MVSSTKVRELGSRSSISVAFFDFLASRKRFSADLPLDVVSRAVPRASKSDLLAIFKEMEDLGLAELRLGRRGFKTRLTWVASPVDVVRAWTGELQEVLLEDGSDVEEEVESADFVEHIYQLRRDLQIRLELPADLSEKEASKLARWLETLPFTDD